MTPCKIKFKEGSVCDEYWHWKFQYQWDGEYPTRKEEDIIYDWCMENLGCLGGWHVMPHGVIILKEEDAMAFKLYWM